jgi:hypothetical protein
MEAAGKPTGAGFWVQPELPLVESGTARRQWLRVHCIALQVGEALWNRALRDTCAVPLFDPNQRASLLVLEIS